MIDAIPAPNRRLASASRRRRNRAAARNRSYRKESFASAPGRISRQQRLTAGWAPVAWGVAGTRAQTEVQRQAR